jgi:hypothetical protein
MKMILLTLLTFGAVCAQAHKISTSLRHPASFLINPLSACWRTDPSSNKYFLDPLCVAQVQHLNSGTHDLLPQQTLEALPRNCNQPGPSVGTIVGTHPECIAEIAQ